MPGDASNDLLSHNMSVSTLEPRRKTMKRSLGQIVRQVARFPISGSMLRWYAPHPAADRERSAPAAEIAIVSLIPYLGDLIFCLPLVDALRSAHPKARLTFICSAAPPSQILLNYPGIDEVIVCPDTRKSKAASIPIIKAYHQMFTVVRFARSVRKTRSFDVALITRGGADPFFAAHAAWLMAIPGIYGYSAALEPERSQMHCHPDPLMTAMVKEKRNLHESMRALEVAEVAGLLSAGTWTEQQVIQGLCSLAERQDFASIAQRVGLKFDERYAVISPGAGADYRKWPAANFREIAMRLTKETDLTVLITGTPAEANLIGGIADGLGARVRHVAGKSSLLELIGLLSKASLFIGSDSGTGHIAGGLGIPTISLNAYPMDGEVDHHQSPARNRPVGPSVTVLQPKTLLLPCVDECRAAQAHCLAQIDVEQVWTACMRALALARVR
jgi:ADP-heptose:LPS heptosyltransferase